MLPASEFTSLEDFHATLLHEAAGHATGHPKRLARLHMDARLGSPEYVREELRADLGRGLLGCSVALQDAERRQSCRDSGCLDRLFDRADEQCAPGCGACAGSLCQRCPRHRNCTQKSPTEPEPG